MAQNVAYDHFTFIQELNMSTNNMNENVQPSLNRIVTVQDYDVLLGRGKLYEKHLGNQNFRSEYSSIFCAIDI
jgi:hypothetical protein